MPQPHLAYAEQVPAAERGLVMPAREPVEVEVWAVFDDGYAGWGHGTASAWSETAVWVVMSHPDPEVWGLYRVWVRPDRVRRATSRAGP